MKVTWEDDPTKERLIVQWCRRCGICPLDLPEIVSPRGTAHFGADWGKTQCGLDATGTEWWWRT